MKKMNRKFNGQSINVIKDSCAEMERQAARVITDAPVDGIGFFLQEQLTTILPEILKQELPNRPALDIFEADNSGAYDQQIVTRMRNISGRHQPTNLGSMKNATIGVGTTANGLLVVDFKGSSEYDWRSAQKAKITGESIDSDIISAHNESYRTVVDEICWKGIEDANGQRITEGALNSSLVISDNKLTKAYDWHSPTTSGEQIVSDLVSIKNQIYSLGGGNDLWDPDTYIMSPRDFQIINTKIFSVSGFQSSMTVRKFCEANFGMKFYATNECANAAGQGKDRILAFKNDARCVKLHLPLPLQFAPLRTEDFNFILTSMFAVAGLNFRQASTFGWLDAA